MISDWLQATLGVVVQALLYSFWRCSKTAMLMAEAEGCNAPVYGSPEKVCWRPKQAWKLETRWSQKPKTAPKLELKPKLGPKVLVKDESKCGSPKRELKPKACVQDWSNHQTWISTLLSIVIITNSSGPQLGFDKSLIKTLTYLYCKIEYSSLTVNFGIELVAAYRIF